MKLRQELLPRETHKVNYPITQTEEELVSLEVNKVCIEVQEAPGQKEH